MSKQCDLPDRMIPRTLAELRSELDSLNDLLVTLGERLEPVTVQIPDPPTDLREVPQLRGECRMASQLAEFTSQMVQLRHRVAGYIERLEI